VRKEGKMTVDPITNKVKIGAIKDWILVNRGIKHLLLFTGGCNLALRVLDLLDLKIGDVRNEKGELREFVRVTESKNNITRDLKVNKVLRATLKKYFEEMPILQASDYLFPGRKEGTHLRMETVHLLIKEATEAVGLDPKYYATHTMRKIWGRMAYQSGKRIEEIQDKLGHKSPATTKAYIGLKKEDRHKLEDEICI